MSFDLILLPEPVGQSWVDALKAERKDTGESPDPQAWDAIVAGVRDVVGEVVLSEDSRSRALTHKPSGLTVRYLSGEATISVPHWHMGAEAEWAVRAAYRIGHVVADATGLAGYDPQLGLPLTGAESKVDDAVAIYADADTETAHLWTRDGFRVYFTGPFTLADAAQRLSEMVVTKESDRFTVRLGDGPQMELTFDEGSRIRFEAIELAEDYGIPEMAAFDRRFEVMFDDIGEVLDDFNTLFEVQVHLQDLTGGYVMRSWNGEVSPPYVDDPADAG
ncbi:hypothetical protein ACGFKZ_26050 [Micromonospora tulbaghiae]|uniref:hypothetical protein n=1 Tax=Micromonospora TaxID=1873 RepID=UPI00207D5396|nr:hypothetical protein [Micromonospora sp. CPM1]MCO1616836.1 hypothetical protein [Micromonospora sp. CPM1]